jgi:protein-tyrosine kinase
VSKNYELLQQTNTDLDLYRTFGSPTGFSGTRDTKLGLAKTEWAPYASLRSNPPRIRWLDSIKKGAKSWERTVGVRNQHRRTDLEAVSREEEIKLVQRVFLTVDRPRRQIVLFSSAEGDAACPLISARTGEILASQSDGPVCVIDADFRWPSLHHYFGIENSGGFAGAVQSPAPIQSFARHIPDRNLWVMASGARTAQQTLPLASNRVNQRIAELRTVYKYVVIHAPPLNQSSDSIMLGRWSDGIVLIVEADSTRRETAARLKENLNATNAKLLGVVLSNRSFAVPNGLSRWF